MNKAVWGSGIRAALAIVLSLAGVSCSDMTRQGTGSSYLIISSLAASPGGRASETSATLSSDVITVVDDVPTVFSDAGEVEFLLGMKDVATPASPNNYITIDRYRVRFLRSDGRNVEGVDVPYGFDGAFTLTVTERGSAGFTLVRIQAKEEAPLRALAANNNVISTIAEVTFYGRDQTGRSVSVTGNISVNFANWGDPQ